MKSSSEYVIGLSDEELFRELKNRGVNVGPISPTTRNIYQKKLEKILSETKTGLKSSPPNFYSPPEAIDETIVKNYTDQELFKALKDRGYNPGPILPTSRLIYEKKLLSLIKKSKLPGYPNLDRSFSMSPKKPEKVSVIQADASISFKPEKPKIVENPVPSLFPSLEFKLIDKNVVNKDKNEDSFMKINNFENTNRFVDPYSKMSHPNDKNNGSYLDYIKSRYQLPKQNLPKHNRKLNLDEDLFEIKQRNNQQESKRLYSINSCNSLYNEPPPPQPNLYINSIGHSQTLTGRTEQKMSDFFLVNFKLIFILISVLIILSMAFSSNYSNTNPIDL